MGTYIYAHVEIKVDDEWLYYAPASIRQWYELFAKMANVRNEDNEIEPISLPRGLPDDVSKMTTLHQRDLGIDAHSDSWLSLAEMCDLAKWAEEACPATKLARFYHCQYEPFSFGVWLFRRSIQGWKEFPCDYPDFLQDVRLVFWFD